MSVQASSWVIQHSKHKGSDLLCLLMIANHAHSDGTNAFPSIPTLAKECRMSARQITRIIQHLEASGELRVQRSVGRLAHVFSVVMDVPTSQPPASKRAQKQATNPDKLTPLNPDNMARYKKANPDKLSLPTLTNLTPNPDKFDVSAFSLYEPSLEPSLEQEGQAPASLQEKACAEKQRKEIQSQAPKTLAVTSKSENPSGNNRAGGRRAAPAVHVAYNPPGREEVEAWLTKHGHDIRHAGPFLSHYGANGWMQNGNKPVFSWPHALGGWVERQPQFSRALAGKSNASQGGLQAVMQETRDALADMPDLPADGKTGGWW